MRSPFLLLGLTALAGLSGEAFAGPCKPSPRPTSVASTPIASPSSPETPEAPVSTPVASTSSLQQTTPKTPEAPTTTPVTTPGVPATTPLTTLKTAVSTPTASPSTPAGIVTTPLVSPTTPEASPLPTPEKTPSPGLPPAVEEFSLRAIRQVTQVVPKRALFETLAPRLAVVSGDEVAFNPDDGFPLLIRPSNDFRATGYTRGEFRLEDSTNRLIVGASSYAYIDRSDLRPIVYGAQVDYIDSQHTSCGSLAYITCDAPAREGVALNCQAEGGSQTVFRTETRDTTISIFLTDPSSNTDYPKLDLIAHGTTQTGNVLV